MKYKILGIGKLQTKVTKDNAELLRKSFKHTKGNKSEIRRKILLNEMLKY